MFLTRTTGLQRGNEMVDLIDYGQNVAAIMSLFCQDPSTCQYIQERLRKQMTGDVGLWGFIAKAGLIFTQEEAPYTAGADFYWYEAIEGFTGKIMEHMIEGAIPPDDSLRRMAWEAIGENSKPSPLQLSNTFADCTP